MNRRSSDIIDTDLVKVAYAHDQVGAEFLQGLLERERIPSVVRRAPGFDVPDLLAAGPRDVLVAAHDAALAREILHMDDPDADAASSAVGPRPSRLLAALLIALALVAAVVCVGVDVLA
ncbi:MAG TPA: hypothetical protein VI318_22520 [Baekduia sp.]